MWSALTVNLCSSYWLLLAVLYMYAYHSYLVSCLLLNGMLLSVIHHSYAAIDLYELLLHVPYVTYRSLTQWANELLWLFRKFKYGCPVHVSASVDRDKDKLIILDVDLHHNHTTSASVAASYPENRRLDANEQDVCASLLDLGVSARTVKDSSGKPLTMRDGHNQQVISDKSAAAGMLVLWSKL